jgi:hypothetical protein
MSSSSQTATRKRTAAVISPAWACRASRALLALMQSALLLLTTTTASEAMSSNRLWRSRSDLLCHQLACSPGIVSESRGSSGTPNSLYDGLDAILLVGPEKCPGNPGVLLGSRDGGAVLTASADECVEPPTPIVLLRVAPAARGAGALHEELTKIAVAACADPAAPWLASRRVCPKDHP